MYKLKWIEVHLTDSLLCQLSQNITECFWMLREHSGKYLSDNVLLHKLIRVQVCISFSRIGLVYTLLCADEHTWAVCHYTSATGTAHAGTRSARWPSPAQWIGTTSSDLRLPSLVIQHSAHWSLSSCQVVLHCDTASVVQVTSKL